MARAREPSDPSERLVFFTDAIVAIALTLLVLPLADSVPAAREAGTDLGGFLLEDLSRIGAFALSFVVIFRFWWAHHRLFRHISRLNRSVVRWTVVWTFSIVLMPVSTAVITAFPTGAGTVALYTGNLVLTSGSLTMLSLVAHRHPELCAGRPAETRDEVLGSVVSLAALVLALVVGTVFASTVGFFGLLLMLLTGPVERLVRRRWSRPGGAA